MDMVSLDMVMVQVYIPTSAHSDEEVDVLYAKIEEVMNKKKGRKYLVVMGDWNATVGEGEDGREIGKYGLRKRTERGEKLVDFAEGRNW
jgi:exonuclease III